MPPTRKKSVQVLAVSTDNHKDSRKLAEDLRRESPEEYDFPFLEDKDHKVIDHYGILNPEGRSWPHPATYIIDREGVVRWKFVEVDYRVRPGNEDLLAALGELNQVP